MRAVGLYHYLPIEHPESLVDVDLPIPEPGPNDLRVRVEAVSVNPVDTKVRSPKAKVEQSPRVLGWDAAGVVDSVGSAVSTFRPGDRVYYAGSIARPGSNAELQLIDHRIVGRMPKELSFADAAAIPLTGLTAWEGLFERLGLDRAGRDRGRSLLVIGAAGGVGSMVIQLAKAAGLFVIATASREPSAAWCRKLGADLVLDHKSSLRPQLDSAGREHVDAVFNTQSTDQWWSAMAELIAPQGRIVCIVESSKPLDLDVLKAKSGAFAWEFMFTRSAYQTPDMHVQGDILSEIAAWIDDGRLVTTRRDLLSPIRASTLREAHARVESGRTIGKIVVSGWS